VSNAKILDIFDVTNTDPKYYQTHGRKIRFHAFLFMAEILKILSYHWKEDETLKWI